MSFDCSVELGKQDVLIGTQQVRRVNAVYVVTICKIVFRLPVTIFVSTQLIRGREHFSCHILCLNSELNDTNEKTQHNDDEREDDYFG